MSEIIALRLWCGAMILGLACFCHDEEDDDRGRWRLFFALLILVCVLLLVCSFFVQG